MKQAAGAPPIAAEAATSVATFSFVENSKYMPLSSVISANRTPISLVGEPGYAFSLVDIVWLNMYTPIHEMGHNMGCHHHEDDEFNGEPAGDPQFGGIGLKTTGLQDGVGTTLRMK